MKPRNMQLEFDRDSHTYTLNGVRVPSVTEVLEPLNDYSMVPPDVLESARVFGQHVHEACDLYDRDELDFDSLDPELAPYVNAWVSFIRESGAVVIASEVRVAHDALGYAGTPDKVLVWRKSLALPDLKVTAVVPPTVGPQTAAYAKAYQRSYGGREPRRYCIHLEPNKYTVHARTDPADWHLFVSALNCHKFKVKHRVRIKA